MKLSEAIHKFLIATKANGCSSRTLQDYAEKLGHLLDFIEDVPVETITADMLRNYVADMLDRAVRYADHHCCTPQAGKLSMFTIAGRVQGVKRLFNWLVEEEILTSNPARRIKKPNPKRKAPKGITHEDLMALLETTVAGEWIDIRDRVVMLVLADTGCRVGGLCGLAVQDVNLADRQMTLTEKGEKTRIVPFSPYTQEALQDWLAVRPQVQTQALFLSLDLQGRAETPLKTRGVSQMLSRRAKRAGITGPVNSHSFRHAFARDFLMSGGDLGTLSDFLGHSTVLVTKDYYGVFTIQELQRKHDLHSPIKKLFENMGGKLK